MLSVVANKTEIIDFLLDQNADVDITDINGDSALTIAKKFNNKLGQHRLTQFKWKKRTDAEIKSRKSAMSEDEDIFPEQRFPHQIFDSSKKTWFKGNFMQVYMMQLVPQNEFSGSSLSAPKSVGKQGKFEENFKGNQFLFYFNFVHEFFFMSIERPLK